jgi:hypothetical protein
VVHTQFSDANRVYVSQRKVLAQFDEPLHIPGIKTGSGSSKVVLRPNLRHY